MATAGQDLESAAPQPERMTLPSSPAFDSEASSAEASSDEGDIQVVGKTTTLQVCAILTTNMVGKGVLSLPATFARGGWLVAPALLILCGLAMMQAGFALDKACDMVEGLLRAGKTSLSFERVVGFEDLFEAAFGRGSRKVAALPVSLLLLCLGGALMILIGQSMAFITGLAYERGVIVAAIVFAPLSLNDDMSIIARLSIIGVVAGVAYVVCIGCAGLRASQFDPERAYVPAPELSQLADLGMVVSVMNLGFTYHTVVPTLRAEMCKPQELPQAITGAVGLAGFVYMVVGSLGDYGWGERVAGNVLESMRMPDGSKMWEGLVLSSAIIANLSVYFSVIMMMVYRTVENKVLGHYSPLTRLVLLFITLLEGLFVPYFLEFFSLLASVLGVFFVFSPIVLHHALVTKSGKKLVAATMLKHLVVFGLGIVALIFGTWTSLQDLIRAFAASSGE